MGIVFRRRVKLSDDTWLNVSKSGASVSKRKGRVTVSSRGRGSVRLGKGISYRFKI